MLTELLHGLTFFAIFYTTNPGQFKLMGIGRIIAHW